MKLYVLLILIIIPFCSSGNSVDIFGKSIDTGELTSGGIGVNIVTPIFNFSTLNVTSADYWNTNLGFLDGVNSTQHSNNGGQLNILESWVDSLWCRLTGCTMQGDIDMGNNDIIDIRNLEVNENVSIGDELYVNSDVFIEDGRLFVGPLANTSQVAVNPGDSVFRGNMIISDSSLGVIPGKYEVALQVFENGADDTGTTNFYLNFSGELNVSTELFCDFVNNPFKANDTLNSIITVFSSEFSTDNIYLAINSFINSSCVSVETGIFRGDDVVELTTVAYLTVPQPAFGVIDGGIVLNGISMYYNTNTSSDQFGSYTRENTLQNRPGGNLFADAFTSQDGNIEYVTGSQTGLNNSGGFWRNSFGIFSTKDYTTVEKTNLSLLHNMFFRWNKINITPRLPYDSQTGGADLAVEHGIETQILHIHDELSNGLIQVFGDMNVVLRNNFVSFNEEDLDIIGPIHIRQPRIETIGVDSGDPLTRLLATFEQGVLFPFTLITSGKGSDEWGIITDINCPPNGDFCSHAGPSGGSGDTIMQVNITTNVTQDMNLSFKLNTDGMTFGGDLDVIIDDNEGNSQSLYSLVGTDVSDINVSVIVPQVYENKTLVTVEFIFSSTHPLNGDVWVDTIDITGAANESTLANVTRLNSLIKLGDGDISLDGVSENGIFYNDTISFTKILGNFTVDKIGVGTTLVPRNLNIKDTMNIQPRVSAPSSAAIGDIYVDSSSGELCFYDGVSWTGLKAGGVCV